MEIRINKETRVKYIKKNAFEGYYAVQVKRWVFWKTIYKDTILANVEKVIDGLAKIDDLNRKIKSPNEVVSKSLNNIVYEGWAVRNIHDNGKLYSRVDFYTSYPSKKENSSIFNGTLWKDANGYVNPIIEIKREEFFGEKCLKPMKLRITIEKIEE